MKWTRYNWFEESTRPPNAGRYLIYRIKCNKMHFEQWNGSGWSSSNNEPLCWCLPNIPEKELTKL